MWGLNENGPYVLIGSGILRRFDLVRVGAALLEKVYQWEWTLRFQKLKSGPVAHSLFLLLVDPD